MRTKLMHSPIDFAEFRKKKGCAGRRSFNIIELTRKLKKKKVKTEPNDPASTAVRGELIEVWCKKKKKRLEGVLVKSSVGDE
jgi:hypothetical protein